MHEHPRPKTAEALMRSRFAAVRDADAEWLLASWHPSTRPVSLDLTRPGAASR
jgi:SEC-C motif domain protein